MKNAQASQEKTARTSTRKSRNKGISRIDTSNTHGWFVRVYRDEAIYSKLFSDRRHGGKRKALEAAMAYRDELETLLNKTGNSPRQNTRMPVVVRNKRNKTGVIGVCLRTRQLGDGKISQCYSVTWAPEPGIQRCTSFSVAKWGKKEAFRKACELREKMIKEVAGDVPIPKATKKVKERKYIRAEKVIQKLKKQADGNGEIAA
ncbi:MAG: hypothetical protein HGB19_08130 [Chlorobiales bacterium]|jgi:hypothetical protein|nr:hypothetical protein [Chlorobiales bacterium]